jgi:predicted nucleotidyltransferase
MNQKDYKIAAELKEKLAGIVPLVDFRVYGSRARGDAGEYSDMDVFVEVETLDDAVEEKIHHMTWETGLNNDFMVISPLVYSRYELEQTAARSSDIVKNIFREGVRI